MAKRQLFGSLVATLLVAGLFTAACGGGTESAPASAPEPEPTQVASSNPVKANPGNGASEEDLFAIGERIFKKEAAEGVGCQYCHGTDGKGNIGPNIRGKMPGDIQFALKNVDAMSFIRLSEEKVLAVSTYLQWLATQP